MVWYRTELEEGTSICLTCNKRHRCDFVDADMRQALPIISCIFLHHSSQQTAFTVHNKLKLKDSGKQISSLKMLLPFLLFKTSILEVDTILTNTEI
jgi:hypothetical protein